MHYGPALHTVTGNWVAGKRKGVIGGVDFGSTGMVCPATVHAHAHDRTHALKHHAKAVHAAKCRSALQYTTSVQLM